MKHLRVLEEAGLLTTRREGRHKLHFLNPVPIQLISDRWISRYAALWVARMADLKHTLEKESPMAGVTQVYEIYIRTTPERLWQALTDGDVTRRYWYGAINRSAWTPGSRWTSVSAEGELYLDGEIVEADAPRRLVHTFHVAQGHDAAQDPPSRVTFEITPMGETCRLSVVHEGMGEATIRYTSDGGWALILSGLKTLLETGEPLPIGERQEASAAR